MKFLPVLLLVAAVLGPDAASAQEVGVREAHLSFDGHADGAHIVNAWHTSTRHASEEGPGMCLKGQATSFGRLPGAPLSRRELASLGYSHSVARRPPTRSPGGRAFPVHEKHALAALNRRGGDRALPASGVFRAPGRTGLPPLPPGGDGRSRHVMSRLWRLGRGPGTVREFRFWAEHFRTRGTSPSWTTASPALGEEI